MFLNIITYDYLIAIFIIHLTNEIINKNDCNHCKDKDKKPSGCFNVIDLNHNEKKNFIINKNNYTKCIFKLNNNICELNMFIYFPLIYVNFKQLLYVLEMEIYIIYIKQKL